MVGGGSGPSSGGGGVGSGGHNGGCGGDNDGGCGLVVMVIAAMSVKWCCCQQSVPVLSLCTPSAAHPPTQPAINWHGYQRDQRSVRTTTAPVCICLFGVMRRAVDR